MADIDPTLLQQLYDRGIIDESTYQMGAPAPVAEEPAMQPEAQEPDSDVATMVERVKPYLVRQESGGKADAVSSKGATGVMQVMPATAADEAREMGLTSYDLKNPEDNDKIGTHYLIKMANKFDGDMELAAAAYNAGPNRVKALLKEHGASTYDEIEKYLPKETQGYVRNINAMLKRGEGQSLDDLSGRGEGEAAPPPQKEAPGILARIGEAIIPSAHAEEPDPAGELENPVPMDPTQALAIDQAGEAAKSGNALDTLGTLAGGSMAGPTKEQLDESFALQTQGKTDAAKALAAGAAKQAEAFNQAAGEVAKVGSEYADKYQKAEAAAQADLDRFRQKVLDFDNASIDPNRIFKRQSTFATILMGVSAAMQAAAGNTQQGIKIITDAIDRDVAIQKANLDLKREGIQNEASLMAANHAQVNDVKQAELMTRAQMIARSNAAIKALEAQTKSDVAKANLQTISGELQQKQLEAENQFLKTAKERAAMGALEASADATLSPQQVKLQKLSTIAPAIAKRMVVGTDGKPLGLVANPVEKQQWEKSLVAYEEIMHNADELKRLYKEHGNPIVNPPMYKTMAGLNADLQNQLLQANAKGLGRFVHFETNYVMNKIPDLFSESTPGAALTALRRSVPGMDEVNTVIDNYKKDVGRKILRELRSAVPVGATSTPELDKWFRKQYMNLGIGTSTVTKSTK